MLERKVGSTAMWRGNVVRVTGYDNGEERYIIEEREDRFRTVAPDELTDVQTVQEFGSTGDAYDACQCDDSLRIVVIPSEKVVGLSWAWPVAVTVEAGELHIIGREEDTPSERADRVKRVIGDAKWDPEQVREAVKIALEKGFEVRPERKAYA